MAEPIICAKVPSQSARTANVALELRTSIEWGPNAAGRITFIADSVREEHSGVPYSTRSRFPILCSLLRHFQVSSGTFTIRSDIPFGSGLGGSGMLVIAMLALIKQRAHGATRRRDWSSLLLIAHLFENWMGFSNTGFHDQLAALFGGANLWTWGSYFSDDMPVFRRTPIVPEGGNRELGKHILLCFTGQSHRRVKAGGQFQELKQNELKRWSRVSEHTNLFAEAVQNSEWVEAAGHLNDECDLRVSLRPACLSSRARSLVQAGREAGAGCRYVGYPSARRLLRVQPRELRPSQGRTR